MNKINDLYSDLPAMEKTFIVDVTGNFSKKRHVGEFTCRIPGIKEQCLINKHKAYLNGDQPDQLDIGTLKIHHMISYLRYTITESPKFWKESDLGYGLFDSNIIEDVYNKVLDHENNWLKSVWGDNAIEGTDGKETESSKT
jgi:hypothetical protein